MKGPPLTDLPESADPFVLQLRQIAREQGIPEMQLTKQAGLSMYGVYRMAHCKNGPRVDSLRRAFDVLGYEMVIQPKRGG